MASDSFASSTAPLMLAKSARRTISGTGPMVAMICAYPWSETPLGPISDWSETLLATVNMLVATPVPMQLLWGQEMTILYNDAFVSQIGAKHPRALGQPAEEVWPEAWPLVAEQLASTLSNGTYFQFERIAIPFTVDGHSEELFWDYAYSPIREADGRIVGILDISQNVTAAVHAQAELQASLAVRDQALAAVGQSEERLRLVLSAANGVGIWDWDVTNDLVYADRQFAEEFSVDPVRAATGCPIGEFLAGIHPEDQARVSQQIGHAMQTGSDFISDYRLQKAGGETRWIAAYGRCRLNERGEPVRFPGLIVDITDRKQTEDTLLKSQAALQVSEDRLRRSQAAGKIASWEWDPIQDVFSWDETSIWVYGRPPAELRSSPEIFAFLHPEDREPVRVALQPALTGRGNYKAEFRVLWPDGSTHWVQAFGNPVLSAEGEVVRISGMNMNISERKRADEALIRTEKLAAVGRLASSIAHEINNPLESVTNLLYLAKNSPSLEEARGYLETADTELRRASSITNQTLRFHRQATRPTAVTSEELLEGILSVHRSRIVNAHVSVERRDRTQAPVLCFEGEIRQVLSNLLGNAVDAMQSGGGRLILRSREARDWATDRKGLAITVADTGLGMSRETVAQVFHAFFTTKGIAGTGLGLWISKEILDRHHGRLAVRSSQQPGRSGTVFVVFLPFRAVSRT